MPVPLLYTVSLSPDRDPCAGRVPRIVIVPDNTDQSMVLVLVPIQYTPLHGHSDFDVSMVEAIVRGDAVCRYPVQESCLEAWLVQHLCMPSTDAQDIVNNIQRKKEMLLRKCYIEMFMRQEPQAYDIIKYAQSVQHNHNRIATLREIFWGLSFYGVRTIDAHLRLHPAEHVCNCILTLHFLWQREYDAVDTGLFLLHAKTFCIKAVDKN